jgi:hypothetical protein
MFVPTVNVLGTDYKIIKKKYSEDGAFERRSIDGYCDSYTKEIVMCDMSTYKGWEHEPPATIRVVEKEILRHEITHAFLEESGLADSTFAYDGGWSKNEEMVDWIARQGLKLYAAWKQARAI